ncbi:MAG: thioredoxin family protein [Planctomycetes bacterium]|nr:thioredoxin family protein [Planctomycetota bacterium]MCH9726446.1 thioredoxin family protein [Planctomycetota bacterium]MCH9778255.1 thioredoxin family protein [Planctomycetota bacterium]MDF1742789.1 thioredoxin family protein [Gimesia sp.]
MLLTNCKSKKQILSIITVTFSLIAISVNQSLAGEWLHDFRSAQKLAQQKDLPILLHFHASWCGPCRQMEQTVLQTQSLTSQFGTRIIAVKIDSDQNQHLVERFNVRSLPSDILLTPTGTIITRAGGSQVKSEYLSFLGRGASRYENDRRVYLAQKSKRELMQKQKSQQENQPSEKTEEKSYIATSPPNVGLEGYSPIALTRDRKWTKGSEEFSWPYQGITYFLSNHTELEIFKNDPGRYAPQLLGCDPVILNKQDRAIPGNTKYGAYYDQNLYLFVDLESREAFKKNPDRFSRTMHVLKIDQIESTILR